MLLTRIKTCIKKTRTHIQTVGSYPIYEPAEKWIIKHNVLYKRPNPIVFLENVYLEYTGFPDSLRMKMCFFWFFHCGLLTSSSSISSGTSSSFIDNFCNFFCIRKDIQIKYLLTINKNKYCSSLLHGP